METRRQNTKGTRESAQELVSNVQKLSAHGEAAVIQQSRFQTVSRRATSGERLVKGALRFGANRTSGSTREGGNESRRQEKSGERHAKGED